MRPIWVLCGLVAGAFCLLTVNPCAGLEKPEDVAWLPVEKLSPESARMATGVTEGATFQLQIGPGMFDANEHVFDYLLDHLDQCAIAGRCLRVGNYRSLRQEDGRFFGDDGEGATGYLTFLYSAEGKRVFHVQGTQQGLFSVGGKSVGVLDYSMVAKEPYAGREPSLRYVLHLWIRVDNRFLAFLTRLFLGKSKAVATKQFTKMLAIPIGVSKKVRDDPNAVLKALDALDEAEREKLKAFRSLVQTESQRSLATTPGSP